MTLAFSTQLNGKPTYFPERILLSLFEFRSITWLDYDKFLEKYLNEGYTFHSGEKPKLHTIREDKSNRWKARNSIHFVINNRTPERFQFAPVVKCVSTQNIEIMYGTLARFPVILIDSKRVSKEDELSLAKNDGFNSYADFTAYFDKDFTGKIIHWTELKY